MKVLNKNLKDFELIMPSFTCDRDCPYCTAKITQWEPRELDLDTFEEKLAELETKGYHFKYFILCGNGEPSLYSVKVLRRVFESMEKHRGLFDGIRVQTSGHIFFENDKLAELPSDTIIEITRAYEDIDKDMQTLSYAWDYTDTSSFRNWKNIRLNMVVLKDATAESLMQQIKRYCSKFKNIKTISIKTLNLNTKDGSTDNKYSQWILNNAVNRNDCLELMHDLESLIGDAVVEYNDRYIWKVDNTEVTLYSAKGKTYGDTHMVYYGNELVDFKLNVLEI